VAARDTNTASRQLRPNWNSALKELRVGKLIIKRFYRLARNQITILASFQELNWCRRIDDPLPRNSGSSKHRLRDTVFALNRNHIARNVIFFEADGTGTGIIWKWFS
jgi:hypothetical protein